MTGATSEPARAPRVQPFASADGAAEEIAVLRELAQRYLEHIDEHVDELTDRIREEIVEYRRIPAEELHGPVKTLITAVLTGIENLPLDAAGIPALEEVARARFAQGVPLDALTRCVQLVAREGLRTADAEARALGIDSRAMLRAYDFTWRFANDAAATISAVNTDIAVELARRDNERRAEFLHGVLHGGIAPSRIQTESSLYGLDPEGLYHPIRARPADQRQEEALTVAIRQTGSTAHHRPMLALLEGELVGLVPGRPEIGGELVAALGEQCELASAREAFEATRPALDAAVAFGWTGVVELADLGPLPLALASGHLADLLERQHFAALDAEGQGGAEIEETVRQLLDHDQNSERVAEALHVHRNTVRYRLRRFRELTGLDIRSTRDLIITWWLLARRYARRHGS
jgi:PucR C-terminal helix-turn-helix domain